VTPEHHPRCVYSDFGRLTEPCACCAAIRAAVEEENKACERIAEAHIWAFHTADAQRGKYSSDFKDYISAAIRARRKA